MTMRKQSIIKEKEQDQNHYCVVCGEIAELMCGKCEQTYYCRVDHQKYHWKQLHSKTCLSAPERLKVHLQNKRMRKTQIFDFLAKQQIGKSIGVISKLIEAQQLYLSKYGSDDIELQIQLGSTVCVYIRLLIASKQFSRAQDILSDYFKDRNKFLGNTSTVKGKEELDALNETERKRWLYLISGKLKLISSLANLMHELIRNSVDMFEILIEHFEKVYGLDSLELSNVYFYTANYLHFLNQNTKALACFLKSAKIRKQKGGTAYYNAALLLLKAGRKKRALQFFHKALELIQLEKNNQNNFIIAQINQNIALLYLETGQSRAMVDYFQKAYFYYVKNNNKEKAEVIMKLFMLIRRQGKQEGAEDMKTVEFTKQKKERRPIQGLSSKNKQKFRNADKMAEEDQRQTANWLASFKELKLNFNQPSLIKTPKEVEYLFGNELKNGQEEDQSFLVSQSNRFGMSEGLNMDYNYMRSLNSNEVGYLHQLNRLLMESKEPTAYFDIVQNSNFYQAVDKQKLNNFYRLNPRLVRPTDLDRRLMLQVTEEDFEEDEEQYQVIEPRKNNITPRLDLTKVKQLQNN